MNEPYKSEVYVKETWVPTKELRVVRRTGEIRPKLIKVMIANVTLTAPLSERTMGKAHNLRMSRVRRYGRTYYTISELRETQDRWTGAVTVSDKWTRVRGVSGKPEDLDIREAALFLRSCLGTEEAIKVLQQLVIS